MQVLYHVVLFTELMCSLEGFLAMEKLVEMINIMKLIVGHIFSISKVDASRVPVFIWHI